MMSDLVSRDWLIAEYKKRHNGALSPECQIMLEAPAVDAVEVVRCKDCAYANVENFYNYGRVWCCMCEINVGGDHFCAFGERREK